MKLLARKKGINNFSCNKFHDTLDKIRQDQMKQLIMIESHLKFSGELSNVTSLDAIKKILCFKNL
jgi:hypothetical protein